MNCLVTKPAPDFTAQAVMPDNSFADLTLSSYQGKKYVVLFFYPLDFTFVCPSEIIAFDKAVGEFRSREHRGHRRFGRLPVHAPGVEEHAAERGRHRPDPVPAGRRPEQEDLRELRRAAGRAASPSADYSSSTRRALFAMPWSTICRLAAAWKKPCDWSMLCSSMRRTARSARPTGMPAKRR